MLGQTLGADAVYGLGVQRQNADEIARLLEVISTFEHAQHFLEKVDAHFVRHILAHDAEAQSFGERSYKGCQGGQEH